MICWTAIVLPASINLTIGSTTLSDGAMGSWETRLGPKTCWNDSGQAYKKTTADPLQLRPNQSLLPQAVTFADHTFSSKSAFSSFASNMTQVLRNSDIFTNNSKDLWSWNQSPFSPTDSISYPPLSPSRLFPQSTPLDNKNSRRTKHNNTSQPSKSQNKQTPNIPERHRSKRTRNISPKRAQHLERNRIAANKCRLKKKREQEAIQRTMQDESAKQDALLAEINCLNEELWCLKNKMFQHAGCDDKIRFYLAGMTQNVLKRSPSTATDTNTSPPLSAVSYSGESLVPGDETRAETGDIELILRKPMPGDTYVDNLFDTFVDAGNA